MANRKFTEDEKVFMRENCKTLMVSEMARQLGWSSSAILRFLRSEGRQQTKEEKRLLAKAFFAAKSTVTPEQDAIIKAEYLITPVKTLAEKIGRSHTLVQTRLRQLGLIIPPELIQQRKIDSRRKPGQSPANKGKKITEYMSPEMIERSKATYFQKGHRPANTVDEIGTIRIRNNKKRNIKSKWILISEKTWKELQHHNWENKHGPVPDGHVLRFKDGDTLNCEIENLEVITVADHMRANTIHNLPPDLKEIIYIKGRIKRQINKNLKP